MLWFPLSDRLDEFSVGLPVLLVDCAERNRVLTRSSPATFSCRFRFECAHRHTRCFVVGGGGMVAAPQCRTGHWHCFGSCCLVDHLCIQLTCVPARVAVEHDWRLLHACRLFFAAVMGHLVLECGVLLRMLHAATRLAEGLSCMGWCH